VSLVHRYKGKDYLLNLIDTPGRQRAAPCVRACPWHLQTDRACCPLAHCA